ncbi:MAG: FAD-dependent oxidoreductase, partial [Gammaproteobacteria bacterium]|nr:FAD-dependent oxidoreductase [Gammaproteobacteria bacterium]
MPADILIAGGGIAGLASALALSQRGHRVELLEQAPAFGEVGAGIQLGPNVTRRLGSLGVWDALERVAATPDALVVRSATSGA